ncbi:MAG: DsbA family protein [Chloroflexi bacterium]|nr:DsbA family protein [Chloroflexota bacterium]
MYRLRKVWPDYRGRVRIAFRALSLELKNGRPTPKPVVDTEIPLMQQQEPDLPIGPWSAPAWRYVPTLLPAFEAEKAAAQQGDEAEWEFSWHLRHAFFARSRTICMRFELEEIARDTGLDVARFLRDWDSGLLREVVLSESRRGWEELKVPGSGTFVLPSGKQVPNPGAIKVTWGPNHEVLEVEPADCPNGDCLQVFRDMLEEASSEG